MSDKKKVLILEDNAMMRSLLQTLMELENFQVTCPTFPIVDPIKTIHENKPDVILMDINLPGTNGLTLLGLIRSENEIKDTRIIISSGSNRKQESLDAGADSFLMKPFMPDELINLVKEYTN
jgi:DNA-binding response OmpR family regulator